MASRPRREPEEGGRSSEPQRSDADTLKKLAEATRGAGIGTPEEHGRLLAAAADGDREALDRLLKAHVDLVTDEARSYTGQGLPAGDLFQEGSIGLMAAINHFSGSSQTDFDAFARQQIQLHLAAALAAERAIERDQALLVAAAEDYEKAEIAVRREKGRPATEAELAQKLEWTVGRTRVIGEMVVEARRRHDEELLQYLDPEQLDFGETGADESEGGANGKASDGP